MKLGDGISVQVLYVGSRNPTTQSITTLSHGPLRHGAEVRCWRKESHPVRSVWDARSFTLALTTKLNLHYLSLFFLAMKPEARSVFWVTRVDSESQALGPSSAASPGTYQGAGQEAEHLGLYGVLMLQEAAFTS